METALWIKSIPSVSQDDVVSPNRLNKKIYLQNRSTRSSPPTLGWAASRLCGSRRLQVCRYRGLFWKSLSSDSIRWDNKGPTLFTLVIGVWVPLSLIRPSIQYQPLSTIIRIGLRPPGNMNHEDSASMVFGSLDRWYPFRLRYKHLEQRELMEADHVECIEELKDMRLENVGFAQSRPTYPAIE